METTHLPIVQVLNGSARPERGTLLQAKRPVDIRAALFMSAAPGPKILGLATSPLFLYNVALCHPFYKSSAAPVLQCSVST
ncbi:hypothetical protein KL86CLO1_11505 [uncultured Eubacteriales bacterium]|uniref:Uncharacterized protein n=1 Tax=uncultured Eubacteriales bacterium TaxID=172733 RepID=A0A212JQ63_9FIRM|nr:hypothetical protein KL86CLO1_11505 [uncultured Eubacteriales bacterium]